MATPIYSRASVVMAAYNGMRFLEPQLRSLLADLRPADEVIIINDASTDETAALIARFDDPRIRYERNEFNLGVLKSFEKAISLARHEVIFLCDQDDIWLPGKRHAVMSIFDKQASCTLVVHDAQIIDGKGALLASSFMATRKGFQAGIASNLLRNKYLGCAMAFRAKFRAVILPIPAGVPMHDMWIGMLAKAQGSVIYLPEPYLQYRRHGGNVSPSHRQSFRKTLKWRCLLALHLIRRVLSQRRSSPYSDQV